MMVVPEGTRTSITIGGWTNLLLGVTLVIAALLFSPIGAISFWNHLLVGLLVIALAGWSTWRMRADEEPTTWASALNAALGLWLIVSAFFLTTDFVALYVGVTLGLLISLMAGFNAWTSRQTRRFAGGRPGA